MEQLQHPARPRLTAAEEAEWLKEYHYTITRAKPSGPASIPGSLVTSCDDPNEIDALDGFLFGSNHTLWIAQCSEGPKLFLQSDGEDPVAFQVTGSDGKAHPLASASFSQSESLVTILMSGHPHGRCGRRLRFGFLEPAGFAMIEDRQLWRCRGVPQRFWPVMWAPSSWAYKDETVPVSAR
jgi:hypothetical protein